MEYRNLGDSGAKYANIKARLDRMTATTCYMIQAWVLCQDDSDMKAKAKAVWNRRVIVMKVLDSDSLLTSKAYSKLTNLPPIVKPSINRSRVAVLILSASIKRNS